MIVCLTGGIGSGKTTVAKIFEQFGVPVYIADVEAKKLMENSDEVKQDIIEFFGKESYTKNLPNRKYLASLVFNSPEKLKKLNSIIHPRVKEHFIEWYSNQHSAYVIKESAILFESGGEKNCEKIILVTATKEERIKRVMKRDKISRKAVLERMNNQWPDKDKRKLSDFIIKNTSHIETENKAKKIHFELLKIKGK
ncbi:dephospho-CoA kinase [Abyssalbus ytuae]|uniref:Dephospho-CoA kinase n=1 Tax=Abyssalbus ytuae TaxID=2926907 RepID=A0A9E6ZKY5_9FLAO|nr:dephospho-CoA kinase [Abyssalbus ytuae]UOB17672.1 dephospho-CoA kinase [Abyssalbus ytuae]